MRSARKPRKVFLFLDGALDAAETMTRMDRYLDVILQGEWLGSESLREIGTPVIRRNLNTSTDWSKSSANLTITKLDKIPQPNTDPRTWPIVYTYEGAYDHTERLFRV